MTLTTRQLSNVGSPLYLPSGVLLSGVSISFTLVDSLNRDTDAFDIVTGERVSGSVSVITDSLGQFTVNLWPNDRGDKTTKYLCRCSGLPDFSSQVPSGALALSWLNFKTSGAILTPAQILALDAHIADAAVHLSISQNMLLDNIDPTLLGAEINNVKGSTSNIQAQLDAMPYSPTKAPLLAGEPNGFIDSSQLTLTWDNNTHTITISPVGSNFQFYSDSVLFTKTISESIQIPNVTGNYYIYYNSSGVLSISNSFDIFIILKWAFVSALYWNAISSVAIPDAFNELHGCIMDSRTHLYLHNTHGTAFGTGILPSCNTAGTGSLLSDVQISTTAGVIWDEDINHTIPLKNLADNIPILYRTGSASSPTWNMNNTSSAVVMATGTGRAAFNENVAGTYQLTECTNGDYVLAHLYAVPGLTTKYIILMGTAKYSLVATARAAARSEITTLTTLPMLEFKLIATFLVQTNTNYTNAVKSRLQQTTLGTEDYVDWRYESVVAGVPSHNY